MTTNDQAIDLLKRWIVASDRATALRRQRNSELSWEDGDDPASAPSQAALLAARREKEKAVRSLRRFARKLVSADAELAGLPTEQGQ